MNVLKILTLNDDGSSTPFPNKYEQAYIGEYEYTASRMGGAPSITAKIKHRLCLDNLWTEKQYVEFRGCKYFVRDTPSSSKDNTDTRYEHDITFLHERSVLENVYMIDSVFTDEDHPDAQPETDKYVSNSTKVVFWGDINEFVGRFNACLYAAGLGGSEKSGGFYVVVDEDVTSEELLVAFEDKFFSEALQEIFNVFKLPYYWVGKCCHIGLAPEEISEVFEYGRDYSLLSIEKQNTNQGYCNRATGTGSSDNIPYYYPNVEAPDVTIPHAVEGNKGITDDASFSIIADEHARERWNEMDSVSDSETPWEGRGLTYIGGTNGGIVFGNAAGIQPRNQDEVEAVRVMPDILPYDQVTGCWGQADVDIPKDHIMNKGRNMITFANDATEYYPVEYRSTWDFVVKNYYPLWQQYGEDWKNNTFDTALVKCLTAPYFLRGYYSELIDIKFRFPFSFTDVKGGVKIELNMKLQRYGVESSENLSYLDLYIVDYLGNRVTENALTNIIPTETGMTPDGFFKLTFEMFDLIPKSSGYCFVVEVRNENAYLEYINNTQVSTRINPFETEGVVYHSFSGTKIYTTVVKTPKVMACTGRWYKEPLNNIAQLSYHRDLSYWGIKSTQTPVIGDRIVRLFKKGSGEEVSPVCTTLMPTIYRDTHGKESFYNALNKDALLADETYSEYSEFYKDEDGNYREYEHEFIASNPREAKYTFEDIKPTIKNMVSITTVDGENVPMNMFLDVAYDTSDNDYLNVDNENNEAKYAHSYFFVKLPKTVTNQGGTERNFNLFACADENGNDMTFSVTSGSCGGCNFRVMVDEETKRNPVLVYQDDVYADGVKIHSKGDLMRDENGNVLLVGNKNASGYTYQDNQQNTDLEEVWVALEKETDTYGIIMPNSMSNLRVVAGDTFVILNIHLPLAYILDAEDRLSKAIIAQMQKDNSERFSFNISFSRVYFEEHPLIAKQISENSKIYVNYNGLTIPLYVNNYTFKNSGGSYLPEISVDLNDEIAIGTTYSQNKQGDISEPISALMGGGGTVLPIVKSTDKETTLTDNNVMSALRVDQDYISKDKDALINAVLHFLKGLVVDGGLSADLINVGAGGVTIKSSGDVYAKRIFVEEGLYVPTINFNRIMGILGYFVISPAGGKAKTVEKDLLTDEDGNVLYQQVDSNGIIMFDDDGNPLTTTTDTGHNLYKNSGWITLDLNAGEAGNIAVGDMLIGFWHDIMGNSNEDKDSRDGDITLKGYQTIYFLVDEIDEEKSDFSRFHYTLRCEDDKTWLDNSHPQPEFEFFGFGNKTDENRQSIMIMSREYSVRLIDKDSWTYGEDNVIEIHGLLEGFKMKAYDKEGKPYTKEFHGYGNVEGNSYIFGTIDQFERALSDQKPMYLTNNSEDKPDYDDEGWSETPVDVSDDAKYMWQYYEKTFTDGTIVNTPIFRAASKGADGKAGNPVNFNIRRWSDVQIGDEFHVENKVGDLTIADIVVDEHGNRWLCKQDFVLTKPVSDYEPKDGSDFWKKFNEFQNIATGLLLADKALIENLIVEHVVLTNGDGTEYGGMIVPRTQSEIEKYGDVRFWLGSGDPQKAPARIDKNGNVHFSKGHFEGVIKSTGVDMPLTTAMLKDDEKDDGSGGFNWEDIYNVWYKKVNLLGEPFISVGHTKYNDGTLEQGYLDNVMAWLVLPFANEEIEGRVVEIYAPNFRTAQGNYLYCSVGVTSYSDKIIETEDEEEEVRYEWIDMSISDRNSVQSALCQQWGGFSYGAAVLCSRKYNAADEASSISKLKLICAPIQYGKDRIYKWIILESTNVRLCEFNNPMELDK